MSSNMSPRPIRGDDPLSLPTMKEYVARLGAWKIRVISALGETCDICKEQFREAPSPPQVGSDPAKDDRYPSKAELNEAAAARRIANVRTTRSQSKAEAAKGQVSGLAVSKARSNPKRKRILADVYIVGDDESTLEANKKARLPQARDVSPIVTSSEKDTVPDPLPAELSFSNDFIISIPPCAHLFHTHCIWAWFNGTSATRNLCPTCDTPLCRLNVLSPAKEAICMVKRFNKVGATWNVEFLPALLSMVDEEFAKQVVRSGDDTDFTHIPELVHGKWKTARRGCSIVMKGAGAEEHALEIIIAERVHERLAEANAQNTWRGQLFVGMYNAMMKHHRRSQVTSGLMDPIATVDDEARERIKERLQAFLKRDDSTRVTVPAPADIIKPDPPGFVATKPQISLFDMAVTPNSMFSTRHRRQLCLEGDVDVQMPDFDAATEDSSEL